MYSLASIDDFLRTCAVGFGTRPPTFDDLRSGRLVLLRAAEIKQRFGFSREDLYRFSRRSNKIQLAYLKFPGRNSVVCYRESDILRLVQKPNTIFSTEETGRIIGRTSGIVLRLVRQGKLERVRNPDDTGFTYISKQSLLSLLRAWLPEWISPEDWLDDCQATTEPLVRLSQAAERLGLGPGAALELLKQRQALFIIGSHGTGQTMVSPIWLAAYEESQKPLKVGDVARLWGVSELTAYIWRRKDLLKCPISVHNHSSESFLFKSCWVAIVKERCSPGLQATSFVTSRLDTSKRPGKLIGRSEAAAFLGCSARKVEEMANSGKLRGVRTPGGMWMFTIVQLKKVRRELS